MPKRREPDPVTTIDSFTVRVIPEDRERYPEFYVWDVKVQNRGDDRWSVSDGFYVYSRWGIRHWAYPRGVYEPRPSERSDWFLRTYRFDREEALQLATELARKKTVNGWRASDYMTSRDTGVSPERRRW